MTQTLQEALLKAGLVTKEKLQKARETRVTSRQKSVGFIEGKHHHHIRTACDACKKSSPDVEYYEHKNRGVDQKWLCVKCADHNKILDQYRQTVQSQHAQSGLFRREYGATKVFR